MLLKFPKNELTSSTSICLSPENEKNIYEALNDLKNKRIIALSEHEDIIEVLRGDCKTLYDETLRPA